MDDNRLRQLLIQTDAGIQPPRTGDLLADAIRRRSQRRRTAGAAVIGSAGLLLAFYAGVWVEAQNRPQPATQPPSASLLASDSHQPLPAFSDESGFNLEQAVLAHGLSAMPAHRPVTIHGDEIPETF
jgi:hypothetical protein